MLQLIQTYVSNKCIIYIITNTYNLEACLDMNLT